MLPIQISAFKLRQRQQYSYRYIAEVWTAEVHSNFGSQYFNKQCRRMHQILRCQENLA